MLAGWSLENLVSFPASCQLCHKTHDTGFLSLLSSGMFLINFRKGENAMSASAIDLIANVAEENRYLKCILSEALPQCNIHNMTRVGVCY